MNKAKSDKTMGKTYFQSIYKILKLDETIYRKMGTNRLHNRFLPIHISMLGIVYSGSLLLVTNRVPLDNTSATFFNFLAIFVAGIAVSFAMHFGMSLFLWVFCRGVGGSPYFKQMYFFTGSATISVFPLASAVAVLKAGHVNPFTYGLTVLVAFYATSVMYLAAKAASKLSNTRMTFAAFITVTYIGCFLYLWH